MVRGSKRVTILPMKVAAAELSIGVLRAVTIEGAGFPRSIGVRKLKDARLTLLAQQLLDALIYSSEL
jgi:hypothetical protein